MINLGNEIEPCHPVFNQFLLVSITAIFLSLSTIFDRNPNQTKPKENNLFVCFSRGEKQFRTETENRNIVRFGYYTGICSHIGKSVLITGIFIRILSVFDVYNSKNTEIYTGTVPLYRRKHIFHFLRALSLVNIHCAIQNIVVDFDRL